MNEWLGSDKKLHRGFIDLNDPYMLLREDDYPGNSDNLTMFNFKRDKVQAYERTQNAINQGLVIFPNSLNARNELEIEEVNASGDVTIRYEKVNHDELNALVQIDLLKEEVMAMNKVQKPNGTIQFDLSPEAKSKSMHDDRVDTLAMMCNRLMAIRADEALLKMQSETDFATKLKEHKTIARKPRNPFTERNKNNPFFTGRRIF